MPALDRSAADDIEAVTKGEAADLSERQVVNAACSIGPETERCDVPCDVPDLRPGEGRRSGIRQVVFEQNERHELPASYESLKSGVVRIVAGDDASSDSLGVELVLVVGHSGS